MYTYTWKKYLPVIRLLLKKSLVADQFVTLNRIDFEKNSKARKPSCSFDIEVINASLNQQTQSTAAKNLIDILMEDPAAKTLLRQNHFAIKLSSAFELTIRNIPRVETPATDSTLADGQPVQQPGD